MIIIIIIIIINIVVTWTSFLNDFPLNNSSDYSFQLTMLSLSKNILANTYSPLCFIFSDVLVVLLGWYPIQMFH